MFQFAYHLRAAEKTFESGTCLAIWAIMRMVPNHVTAANALVGHGGTIPLVHLSFRTPRDV